MSNGFIAMIVPKLNQNLSFDFFLLIETFIDIAVVRHSYTLLAYEFNVFSFHFLAHSHSWSHLFYTRTAQLQGVTSRQFLMI